VIEPGLRGRPVVVAPPGSARAPVLVVSQEAAREGVRTGMPLPAALLRCPGLVVLPANEPLYRRAEAAILALLAGFSPLVEPAAAAGRALAGSARRGARAPFRPQRPMGGRSPALLADAAPGRLRGTRWAAALPGARDRWFAGPPTGGGPGGRRGGNAR